MPLNIPQTNPLTSTQSELTAKIGSMKSLLSLPFVEQKTISKEKQVSSFDYLSKILSTMGVGTDEVFSEFNSQVLDENGTFLEDAVVDSTAQQLYSDGVKLPGENFSFADTSAEERAVILERNKTIIKQRLSENGQTTFLQNHKKQIAKDLTLAVFGPKNGPAAEYLNPNLSERERIINNSVCAVNSFSISNSGFERNEDVEYNRIALAKQLEKGEVVLEISCQEVKIKLPQDPSWIFEGGNTQTIESSPVTPAQSLDVLGKYVESTSQQINQQQNSKNAGKTFAQILVEKFISNITNLVKPFMGGLISSIQQDLPPGASVTADSLVTNTCEILNNSSSSPNKKVFGEKITNELYKKLLNLMLILAIREFKKLTRNYFARIARERAKRKLEKIKARFSLVDNAAEEAEKATKYAQAISSLSNILGDIPVI